MIVPFIFNMSTYAELPYSWFFFKSVSMVKKNGWPIIAQEQYFNTPLSGYIKAGIRNAYDKPVIDEHFWYDVPKKNDLRALAKYPIREEITDRLIEETGSYNDAFIELLRKPYEPLVNEIKGFIKDIKSKYNEPVEAICTLCHIPSLSAAAESFGIPVVHYELGPFREPVYLKTAYYDLQSPSGGNTVEIRYKEFLKEMKNDSRLLSGKEILALLLDPANIELINRYGERPSIKYGAALGYAITELFLAQTGFNDGELLYRMTKAYGRNNVRFRTHPSDPYGASYKKYADCRDTESKTVIDFILACEEVFSVGSNVCIEAMFWGRRTHVMVKTPPYYGAAHSVEERAKPAEKEYLNFFAFNYLTPYRFMMDPEYIRWRLTNPTEKEIFEKHMSVHLKNKGLDESVLAQSSSKRLAAFKDAKLNDAFYNPYK